MAKDLYTENYKSLMREIEEDKEVEDIFYLWMGKMNIIIRSILPKAIYRISVIPIKVPLTFFKEIEEAILNSCGTTKDPKRVNLD